MTGMAFRTLKKCAEPSGRYFLLYIFFNDQYFTFICVYMSETFKFHDVFLQYKRKIDKWITSLSRENT